MFRYTISITVNQFVKVLNDANFDGTYILTNLSPYTVYVVYVTAVRLIGGDIDRSVEGMNSAMLIERTLAGGKYNACCSMLLIIFNEQCQLLSMKINQRSYYLSMKINQRSY